MFDAGSGAVADLYCYRVLGLASGLVHDAGSTGVAIDWPRNVAEKTLLVLKD